MKTKVIMYDHTGNNVINRHKELTPFAENIYTTFIHKDSCGIDTNDMFGIVFAIKGVYFLPEYCNRDRLADSNYKLLSYRLSQAMDRPCKTAGRRGAVYPSAGNSRV